MTYKKNNRMSDKNIHKAEEKENENIIELRRQLVLDFSYILQSGDNSNNLSHLRDKNIKLHLLIFMF